YAIFSDRLTGKSYFSKVNTANGDITIIKIIPSFAGFNESTFDSKNHRYIFKGDNQLYVINTSTGDLVYNPSFPPGVDASCMQWNNTTGMLYAVCTSNAWPKPKFASIPLATAVPQVISELPPTGIPYIFTSAIDEAANKFFFVGIDA